MSASENNDSELAPGDSAGDYRIVRKLGQGATGTVYAAEEPRIGRSVALKVLHARSLTDHARLLREARAANAIRHPAIVDVFAAGTLPDGRPYLVMPLLEGKSLSDALKEEGRFAPAQAWNIARTAAEALGAAHDAGIIHRDLKPGNIFLERGRSGDAITRVLDFGLAKLNAMPEGQAQDKLTHSGVFLGTPAYAPPEQWWNEGISEQSDQYALGAMLFELLTGSPPFSGAHFVELAQKHLNEPPPSLSDKGIAAPNMVEAFLRRTLAKTKSERFPSMRGLIEEGDRAFEAWRMVLGETIQAPMPLPTTEKGAPHFQKPLTKQPPAAAWLLPVPIGIAAMLGVGYAGQAQYNPREWLVIAGAGSYLTLTVFILCTIALKFIPQKETLRAGLARFAIAFIPAFTGALGTYTGWAKVRNVVSGLPATEQLTTFLMGIYEANAGRFLGFACSAILCAQLIELSINTTKNAEPSPIAAQLNIRREALAASAGVALLAIGAFAAAAPSAGLIAATAAGLLLLGFASREAAFLSSPRTFERALSILFSLGLTIALGFARVEARQAALWNECTTRAERALEVIAADAERTATYFVSAVAALLVSLLLIEDFRRRMLLPHLRNSLKSSFYLVVVIALLVFADVLQHQQIASVRSRLHEALAPQFALFARLDPPMAPPDLNGAQFAPDPAPAVQLTRDTVALNGKGIAKLGALHMPAGAANIGHDLNHALVAPEVPERGSSAELSILADRSLNYGTLLQLLRIAKSAGVTRAELLLAKGHPISLPLSAPPETGFMLPGDFAGIEIALSGSGLNPPAEEKLDQIYSKLIEISKQPDSLPIQILVPGL